MYASAVCSGKIHHGKKNRTKKAKGGLIKGGGCEEKNNYEKTTKN